ncbi:MAG: aspartate/glutamate racemase family protein [Solirubrobacteraceae bacterium]
MKVLWQSFLDPAEHRPYITLVRSRLEQLGGAEVEFDVVGVRPPDRFTHPLTEMRCGLDAIRNVIWAARAGYDGAVIGHFQEPGLTQARASVAMPVIGVGEALIAAGCAQGEMLGLVTIDPAFIPWHEAQLRLWEPSKPVAGVAAMRRAPAEFMAAMEVGLAREELIEHFMLAARELVAAGADTLIPAGVLPAIALCREGAITLSGARIPDALAAAVAEVRCAVEGGASPTDLRWRSSYPLAPEGAIEEFIAATGGPLTEPVR